jgi:hypothetical protein
MLDQLQVVIVDFEFQLWSGFLSHSDMTCPMFLRNTLKDGKEVQLKVSRLCSGDVSRPASSLLALPAVDFRTSIQL